MPSGASCPKAERIMGDSTGDNEGTTTAQKAEGGQRREELGMLTPMTWSMSSAQLPALRLLAISDWIRQVIRSEGLPEAARAWALSKNKPFWESSQMIMGVHLSR